MADASNSGFSVVVVVVVVVVVDVVLGSGVTRGQSASSHVTTVLRHRQVAQPWYPDWKTSFSRYHEPS
uniref:Putative secreted protein n=1 Tax=Anopheles darlingi TaxID=43151 RepID=A0A2M4DG41_ANODA